ncbi:MAG: metallophosphoesterase [Nanoarchaeota archaeon]|nr:metallophosphoesterase [Nanoarchaeota archaeon]
MKFLAAGDIHGDKGLARKLSQQAEDEGVDFVVLCGDIVEDDDNVSGIVGQFKKPVFLIPGNHESPATTNFLAEFYNAKNIQGYGYKMGDLGLVGCSSVNLGLWQMPEKDIFEMIKKGSKYVQDCKKRIFVSHVHPAQSKSALVSGFEGSVGLRKAIDEIKPDIVLCSHVHEAEGIEEMIGNTKVLNVGKKGKIIEI